MAGALGLEGNDGLQKRLGNYLKGGRVHPGLLISGPDREAKLALGRQVAKFLLCREPGPQGSCGQCSVCRRVEKDLHPDVLMLTETEEDTIKIDTIRDVCHQMEVSPIEAQMKICVIDECHRMNPAAANAFLKTLEEPGPNRLFLLLTSQPGALLPTILSRCLEFNFKPLAQTEDTTLREPLGELLHSALLTGEASELVAALKEKEEALQVARALMGIFRQRLAQGPFSPQDSDGFEAALELEGRLRSNANYALMVDGFFRSHFAPREF